jgi:hypothetical protein
MVPITFLSPLFLVGLLAAAIPLVLHLSRSRRTKKMRFSTTRFFTDQFLRSYRMSRLKELLLLALRVALCALLALALARPLYAPRGRPFLMGGARSVALVIDNSASMGYTENGQTLLDRARGVARELLEGLGSDDTVSVVLAARREAGPEVLFEGKPAREVDDVVHAVNALPVATLGTDLAAAVIRAEAAVTAGGAPSKEVYVLSDLQDTGLRDAGEGPPEGGSEVAFFFVSVRPKKVSNRAVTAVQYGTTRPTVGVPFLIRAHVATQGDQTQPGDVRLYVDGQKVGERRLERLPDGRWVVNHFHHTFTAGGWHAGYVEITDDALPLDNRRYFAVDVVDTVKVLAVNGAPSRVPRLDELFFLRAALNAGAERGGPITVDAISPADLAARDLKAYRLIILANVESLPAPAVEALEAFADRGGGVLVFLGDRVNKAFYDSELAAEDRLNGGLLPGALLRVQGDPNRDGDLGFVSAVAYEHPALAPFRDPGFANLWGVTFKAVWKVDPRRSAVLMRLSTGAPLLLEKPFGKGRVLLFSSTCDRDWTNFPVRPAYLPWLHLRVSYLAQEPAARQGFSTTGDWLPVAVSSAEALPRVLVERFDPEKKTYHTVGPAAATDDPDRPLVFKEAVLPGVYRFGTPERRENAPLVAVNLTREESDLTYLGDAFGGEAARVETHLQERLGRPLVTYVDDPARVADVSLTARRGVRLWDYVLGIVLVIALLEPWLANRISARHYARPKDVPDGNPGREHATRSAEGRLPMKGVSSISEAR